MISRYFYIGRQYGLRIDVAVGAWLSLGVHVHTWPIKNAHITFHLIWFIVCIGRTYSAASDDSWIGSGHLQCDIQPSDNRKHYEEGR